MPAPNGALTGRLRPAILLDRGFGTTFAVAALTFFIAFDAGTYGEASRDSLAIAIWWTLILAVGFGVWPSARPTRAAYVCGGCLLALALLTLGSIAWAASAEKAFAEFNRVSLYLGIFLVTTCAGTRANLRRWSDGIAIGICAVGLLALASRFFPDAASAIEARTFLPSAYTRLSYPVGYWNALAILLAFAPPLLLRAALAAGGPIRKGLAVAPFPALAAAIYLTSSRGGVATALFATLCFVCLTRNRWAAFAATALVFVGSLGAVLALQSRPELVNGPLDTGVASNQGRSAALLIAVLCLLCGAIWAAGWRAFPRGISISPLLGRIAAVGGALLALAAVLAADPLARFEAFKEPPSALAAPERDFVRAHLLTSNGSGRWQFWSSALDQFEGDPILGDGAGSYEAWWAENGTLATFIRDAHSLYAEALGELGVIGFLFLLGALATGVAVALKRCLRSSAEDRPTVAALAACYFAFVLAAAVDWIWEVAAVSAVGVVALALLVGPATAVFARPRLAVSGERPRSPIPRFSFGVGLLLTAWLLIVAHAIPLLAGARIRASESASARGDFERAASEARSARDIQPWAATPYQQLALVAEGAGRLSVARSAVRQAIERDRRDWRLWYVKARIETKLGEVEAGVRSLERAVALNPRSTLFVGSRRARVLSPQDSSTNVVP